MTTIVTAVLAAILAIGTGVGLVNALNDTSHDRVKPSSTAPVYGTP